MISFEEICLREELNAEWGGLETLLAAAQFLESREQERSPNLIEIREEYPSTEKNFSAEPTPSLRPIHNHMTASGGVGGSSLLPPLLGRSNILAVPSESAISNSSQSVISSTSAALSSLPNGCLLPSAVVSSGSSSGSSSGGGNVHSFAPSPSITFTFTTPSPDNQNAPPLLKIPSPVTSAVYLPNPIGPSHLHEVPLIVQQKHTHTVSYSSTSPPPSIASLRNVPHHPVAAQQPQINHCSPHNLSAPALPHRTYPERPVNGSDNKRKISSSGTREVHNKLEKNRRAHLKECFELLKHQVPAIQDEKKPSNLTILRTAIRYVQILRRREQELESELELLARDKIVNQQRLTTLKKELTAQWDHIDFNALIPESVELPKAAECVENGGREYKDIYTDGYGDKMAMSDMNDNSSHVKSRGDSYYGSSSSPTGSCSISPLHISSANVVATMSDNLPPQIHIVESASTVAFDKLSSSLVVGGGPLQLLSTCSVRTMTDVDEPMALIQPRAGDKLCESATLPKMAVHAGNTFTIFSGDSYAKLDDSSVTATGNCVSSSKPSPTASLSTAFIPGLTLPASASVNHKNSSNTADKCSPAVLTTVPVQSAGISVANHSFVVAQPASRQMLIATTSQPNNVMPSTPVLKTVSRLQSVSGHQLVMKPATAAVVVVNSSTVATK